MIYKDKVLKGIRDREEVKKIHDLLKEGCDKLERIRKTYLEKTQLESRIWEDNVRKYVRQILRRGGVEFTHDKNTIAISNFLFIHPLIGRRHPLGKGPVLYRVSISIVKPHMTKEQENDPKFCPCYMFYIKVDDPKFEKKLLAVCRKGMRIHENKK